MIRVVLLDAGPLGLVCNTKGGEAAIECNRWLARMRKADWRIVLSAIADFEVRRELIRADKGRSISVLDRLVEECIYMPVTQEVVLKASDLWAQARKDGRPTADPLALDADVLIAAQAACLDDHGFQIVVATFNAAHIGRYVTAQNWMQIRPGE